MTEHSAVIFVFFFLAEYGSIVLICILTSLLFLGGYIKIFTLDNPTDIFYDFNLISVYEYFNFWTEAGFKLFKEFLYALTSGLSLGFKACLMIFVFILARAAYPRIRYDQLMSDCWTIILPTIIGLIVLIPCLVYALVLQCGGVI